MEEIKREFADFNVYPHKVFASVLLLDGKIYNWKIKNTHWTTPMEVKMRYSDFPLIDEGRFTVEWTSFMTNNSEEHSLAFTTWSREWYSQWEVSDKKVGASPFGY
jgi:hypothetical protein